MKPLLNIIMTQYKEEESIIAPLLFSIDHQLGIDWNEVKVTIINDCSDVKLSTAFLQQFKNSKPEYISLEKNVGLGLCRQAGIDRSNADYVMFCDADDRFYSCLSLLAYMIEIKGARPQATCGMRIAEGTDGKDMFYHKKEFDGTFVHGKVFNRQFLIDNDIRFHPRFKVQEDSYFIGLVHALATHKTFIQDHITYVWCYNKNSISNSNGKAFVYKDFDVLV